VEDEDEDEDRECDPRARLGGEDKSNSEEAALLPSTDGAADAEDAAEGTSCCSKFGSEKSNKQTERKERAKTKIKKSQTLTRRQRLDSCLLEFATAAAHHILDLLISEIEI